MSSLEYCGAATGILYPPRVCLKTQFKYRIKRGDGFEFVSWRRKPRLLRWILKFHNHGPGGGDA